MKKEIKYLFGFGLILTTASLFLLLKNKSEEVSSEKSNNEDEKANDKNEKKEDQIKRRDIEKKNKDLINNILIDLVNNEELYSLPDLLTNLISEAVKRSKDIDILYDTPKNIEELEEALVLIDLYDKAIQKISKNDK